MHREVEHLMSQFSKHSWPNHHFWISCRDGICCGAELVDLWFIYHYLSIIIYLLSLTFYLFFCALGKKKRGTCGCKLKARDFAGILFKWEGNFKLNRFFFFLFFFSFFHTELIACKPSTFKNCVFRTAGPLEDFEIITGSKAAKLEESLRINCGYVGEGNAFN